MEIITVAQAQAATVKRASEKPFAYDVFVDRKCGCGNRVKANVVWRWRVSGHDEFPCCWHCCSHETVGFRTHSDGKRTQVTIRVRSR